MVTATTQPSTATRFGVGALRIQTHRHRFRSPAASLLILVTATTVFTLSAASIDPRAMNGLGLISVLPVTALAALLVANLSFCLALRRPAATWLLIAHTLVLMFMLYGVTTIVEGVTHYQATYRHVGIIDHLVHARGIDPTIDAYFDWPGFFGFAALLVSSAGIHSALELTSWATLCANLLFLGPLVLILRALTTDRRLVWLGIWLYTLTNWVGQDYFSPQSFSYFLILVLTAVVLRWFPRRESRRREHSGPLSARTWTYRLRRRLRPVSSASQPPGTTAAQSAGLVGIVALVFAAIVMTHQLTPTAALLVVTAAVLVGACRLRTLPLVMIVMIVVWLAYAAIPFVRSNVLQLADSVGAVGQNVGAGVAHRVQGSSAHLVIVRLRLFATVLTWALAAGGVVARWRSGRVNATAVAMFVAPFGLLALQPYGGEIALRVYFFALPFAAYHAAALLRSLPWRAESWKSTGVIMIVTSVLGGALLFTRYGNESSDFYTPQEISAVRHLYQIAPLGSVVYGDPNLPWRFEHYTDYTYEEVADVGGFAEIDSNPQTVRRMLENMVRTMRRVAGAHRVYLVITRSGLAWLDLLEAPAGRLERVEAAVVKSRQFRLLYANRDAKIFVLVR